MANSKYSDNSNPKRYRNRLPTAVLMKQFDLYTGGSNLQSAFEALQVHWQATADHWRDDVSHQFAQNHLDPLSPLIKNAVDAIGRMAAVIDRAERDCGDERESGL